MPRGDSMEEIIRRIEGSEATKVRRAMMPVEITHEIFRGNLNELVKALESYEDPEYRGHLWLGDEQLGSMTTLDRYMTEVFRLLHNFVASVMTLVEHTRATMRKLYEGQVFLAEYEARVSQEFDASELAHFVQDLRDYFTHRGLLPMKARGGAILLGPMEMATWKGWSASGRAYLDQLPQWIPYLDFVRPYGQLVEGLYEWVKDRQQAIHRDAFEELSTLQARLREAREG
jgi:hypothetical protein